jgi:prevent-host-death family protein
MREINITELRKHLPAYLKRVARGEKIRLISNGKALARIVPEEDPAAAARGRLQVLRGTMVLGDIVGPIDDVI